MQVKWRPRWRFSKRILLHIDRGVLDPCCCIQMPGRNKVKEEMFKRGSQLQRLQSRPRQLHYNRPELRLNITVSGVCRKKMLGPWWPESWEEGGTETEYNFSGPFLQQGLTVEVSTISKKGITKWEPSLQVMSMCLHDTFTTHQWGILRLLTISIATVTCRKTTRRLHDLN